MSDYQEAKKKDVKKSSVSAGFVQSDEENLVQNAFPCPGCGQTVLEEAAFCSECGYNLKTRAFCTNCGAAIIEGADICESCKSWILDGQCMFCYAFLEKDAAFCEECGNPRDGIKCPDCGNLSIFDFCTKCGKPLTESAVKSLELAKTDPDARALVDSIQETVGIEAEIAKLQAFINDTPAPAPIQEKPQEKKMSRFSDSKMAAILKTDQNIDAVFARQREEQKQKEEYAKKQSEETQKKEAEQRQRVHEREVKEAQARMEALEKEKEKALAAAAEARAKLKLKTFASNQDARCFHNARRPVNPRGWLCNYADCLHEDGPNGCYKPSDGGEWVS